MSAERGISAVMTGAWTAIAQGNKEPFEGRSPLSGCSVFGFVVQGDKVGVFDLGLQNPPFGMKYGQNLAV